MGPIMQKVAALQLLKAFPCNGLRRLIAHQQLALFQSTSLNQQCQVDTKENDLVINRNPSSTKKQKISGWITFVNRFIRAKNLPSHALISVKQNKRLEQVLKNLDAIPQQQVNQLSNKEILLTMWMIGKIDDRPTRLLRSLLDECCQRAAKFNALEVATIFYTLGKIGWMEDALLQQLIDPFLRHANQMKWYELSNVSWACAKLQFNNDAILTKIRDRVQSNIDTITNTDFIRILFTLSQLNYDVTPLLGYCHDQFLQDRSKWFPKNLIYILQLHARQKDHYINQPFLHTTMQHLLQQNLKDFAIDDLCSYLHLYTAIGYFDEQFFHRCITTILSRSDKVNIKNVRLILWSCLTAQCQNRPWFQSVIQLAMDKISSPTPIIEDIIPMLRIFALADYSHHKMLNIIYSKIIQEIKILPPRYVATVMWASAKINYWSKDIMDTLITSTINNIRQFYSHDLSLVLWSLATVNYTPSRQAIDIFKQRVQQIGSFRSQDLCNSIWAMSKLEIFNQDMYDKLADTLITHLPDVVPQGLSNIALAYSWQSYLHKPLFTELVDHILTQSQNLNCQSIANIAWSFSNLNFSVQPINDMLISQGIKSVTTFQPFELTTFVWSLIVMKQFPLELISIVLQPNFVQDIMNQSDLQGERKCEHQLYQIDLATRLEYNSNHDHLLSQSYRQKLLNSFIDQATNKSRLHESVYNELVPLCQDQNYRIFNEYKLDCGYSTDIFLQYNGKDPSSHDNDSNNINQSICIEVDGPDHFLVDSYQLKGPTEMKYRHLSLLGHQVIQIPYFEWNQVNQSRRKEYLFEKLKTIL
ncbi:Protein TBRG4 [Trichoplax sp. H2]|nr:Protein TBRG4 [Trichoplax sp. H2]|eukprot:RDD37373.1 Protein TBRG4 [Trichoplax sp. H2]